MSRLSLFFLGPPGIECDGVPIKVDTNRAIALLSYLAISGENHRRDRLASLLCPDYDQSRARAILRQNLYVLNKSLGEGWLEVQGEMVGLKGSDDLWLDVDRFHGDLSECRTHGHGSTEVCPQCIKPLTEAVGLYRDDFLAGFTLNDSVVFDDWQFSESQSLHAEVVNALERLVHWHSGREEGSRLEVAIGHARRCLELDRTNEGMHRQLMESYAKTGQRSAALKQYDECVRVLEKELKEAPKDETTSLYQQIKENVFVEEASSLERVSSLGEVSPMETVSPTGEVSPSEREVKTAEVDPPKQEEGPRNNLPVQLTSFIGREREMEEIVRLLTTTHLLTLTGSGGCGKTRLALEVAAQLVGEYEDGVWVVELASLSDPALVPQEVASVLDVSEQPGRSFSDTLSDYLKSKNTLLLLDNCEHLIDACATLSETLLRSCPNLKIIAGSREALGIGGELTYRVPSLSLPDPEELPTLENIRGYEALNLFIERATFNQSTFTVTGENVEALTQICHRLDGIPLALELAAARVKALSLEQILERLDDRFRLLTGGSRTALPRQQTLRSTIDWSYNQLSEKESALFNRTSVFMGGWTLDAAEAICASKGVEDYEVLDLLTQLVEKSLVVIKEASYKGEGVGEARYRLLETVRQYSRDKLADSGEATTLRDRHLEWYLGLAEQAEPELSGLEQVMWLDRLEEEHDNLRAALEWSLGGEKAEEGLRLAGTLFEFWDIRGYTNEGHKWIGGALSKGSKASASVRAKALIGIGQLEQLRWEIDKAKASFEESLALCQEVGDKRGIADSIFYIGLIVKDQRDYERAEDLYKESLALQRELGNKEGIARSLLHLGAIVMETQSNYQRAAELYRESLALYRELGDKRNIARSLRFLGHTELMQGNYERAEALYEEVLALAREGRFKNSIAFALLYLGQVAGYQGDYSRATALLKESLVLIRELGVRWAIDWPIESLAGVAGEQGQLERAARLYGAVEALREAINVPAPIFFRFEHDPNVAAVRAGLGEDTFEAARAEGRAMTMEEAIEFALSQ